MNDDFDLVRAVRHLRQTVGKMRVVARETASQLLVGEDLPREVREEWQDLLADIGRGRAELESFGAGAQRRASGRGLDWTSQIDPLATRH